MPKMNQKQVWTKLKGDLYGLQILVLAFCLAYMFWVTLNLQSEYYDAFEYLLGAQQLFGDTQHWVPKNPSFTALLAVFYWPWHVLKIKPQLTAFHLPLYFIHVFTAFLMALVCKTNLRQLNLKSIPFAGLFCIALFNRIFVHFMPFAHPDLFAALAIALWLWIRGSRFLNPRLHIFFQILSFALIALGRPQTLVIPLVDLLWSAWFKKQFRSSLLVIIIALPFAVLGFAFFHWMGSQGSIVDGFFEGIQFIKGYGAYVKAEGQNEPFYVPLIYIFKSYRSIGFALLLSGSILWIKRSRHSNLFGCFLGSLAYLAMNILVMHKEARYCAPLLPMMTLLIATSYSTLSKSLPRWAPMVFLGFFISILPEFLHFADPYYRTPIAKEASLKILNWSKSQEVVFMQPMAALYPQNHIFDLNDGMFYIQHYSSGALKFFTGIQSYFNHDPLYFSWYGYPIFNGIDSFAPQGQTLIIPSKQTYMTHSAPQKIEPIYLLRWWSNQNAQQKNIECAPQVKDFCVEVIKAYEGQE